MEHGYNLTVPTPCDNLSFAFLFPDMLNEDEMQQQKERTKTVPAHVEYCIVQPGHLWPNQLNHSRCRVRTSVDFTATKAVLGSSVWHVGAVQ